MRKYLLDTSVLAAYLLGHHKATTLVSPWITRLETATSIIVYGEVYEYIRGMPNFSTLNHQLVALVNGAIRMYNLNMPIMQQYADIRRSLRGPGKPGIIGDTDTLIAATAIEHDLAVVTRDSDFQRVVGLKYLMYR